MPHKLPNNFNKTKLVLFAILLSSFGPYIFSSIGVRLEHIVIYLFLLFILFKNSICVKKHKHALMLLFSLFLLIVIPLLGYILLDKTLQNSLVISQLENYTQPLAIVIVVLSLLHNSNYLEVKLYFDFILKGFVILMAFHTPISITMLAYPDFDFWRMFTGNEAIDTVFYWKKTMNSAQLAATAGRSSGIFTQIFESGYAYSLALIFWAYLKNFNTNFIKYSHTILLLIFIGGLITYSKVFLVLGIFFFVLMIKNIFLLRYLLLILFFIPLTLFFDLDFGLFEKGSVYLKRLIFIPSDYSIFDIYTSGRFSDTSTIIINMQDIFFKSPIFGYGYGSIKTSDFSLYEVIFLGGLAGVLIYLFLFLQLFYFSFSIKDKKIRKLCIYIMLITLLTSISAPTITANRVSIIFWIVISLVMALNMTQFNRGLAKSSKTIMTNKKNLL